MMADPYIPVVLPAFRHAHPILAVVADGWGAFVAFGDLHPLAGAGLMILFLVVTIIAISIVVELRLSPWVYKPGYCELGVPKRCYALIPNQRLYRGQGGYLLWSPCYRIVPGLWICAGTHFYLDRGDFVQIWARQPKDEVVDHPWVHS